MNPTQRVNTLVQQKLVIEDRLKQVKSQDDGFSATLYLNGRSYSAFANSKRNAEFKAATEFLRHNNLEITNRTNARKDFLAMGGSYSLDLEQDPSRFTITLTAQLPNKLPRVFVTQREVSGGVDAFIKTSLHEVIQDVNK